FTHPATTEIYTLSLHDALPICSSAWSTLPRLVLFATVFAVGRGSTRWRLKSSSATTRPRSPRDRERKRWRRYENISLRFSGSYRSEEHTSELQSRGHLVCRLLL